MMTPFPPKTPAQMRREAEHGPPKVSPPLGPVDPAKRPPLADDEYDADNQWATAEWLAHIAAGRIDVR